MFESDGADQLVVLGDENDQLLHQRLTNILARLARDGATGTTVLQSCPLQYVPVLEVVADALLDTGAVNSVDFSTVTHEEGRFSLSIFARDPADATIVRAACEWLNRKSQALSMTTPRLGSLHTTFTSGS